MPMACGRPQGEGSVSYGQGFLVDVMNG